MNTPGQFSTPPAQDYFLDDDVFACAQHVEAKKLANKLWRKWSALGDKLFATISGNPADFDEKRHQAIATNCDDVKLQFDNLMRGLRRCCVQ